MSANCFFVVGVLLSVFASALALQCFQCGMYNDGVGSITPCINETHMKLRECPRREHSHCLKYVSEGTTVRDCAPKCIEREDWRSHTFCCNEDGCNGGFLTRPSVIFIAQLSAFVMLLAR